MIGPTEYSELLDMLRERAARLAEIFASAPEWQVESRILDPDSPWAGGITVTHPHSSRPIYIVASPDSGYIAAVSSYNDYSGRDAMALAQSLLDTRY